MPEGETALIGIAPRRARWMREFDGVECPQLRRADRSEIGAAAVSLDDLEKVGQPNWFPQEGLHAGDGRQVGGSRQDDHGKIPQTLVALHGLEDLPAVHARHPEIEQEQAWGREPSEN